MLRVAAVRRSTIAFQHAHPRVAFSSPLRAAITHGLRFNATKPPSSSSLDLPPTADTPPPRMKRERTPEETLKKANLEKQDDLQRDWDAQKLTYEEFLPRTLNPSPNTYIIDVREREEVMQGMIPGAVNIPLSVLSNSLHLAPSVFSQKFGFEKPKIQHELVFYCRSGMRATSAADVAKRNGYSPEKIYNYKGSWLEWTAKQK